MQSSSSADAGPDTVTVSVRRAFSSNIVLGPEAVPRTLTVGGLRRRFKPDDEHETLVLNLRILSNNEETLENWPDPAEVVMVTGPRGLHRTLPPWAESR